MIHINIGSNLQSNAGSRFDNITLSVNLLKEAKVIVAIRPGFRPSDIPHWILKDVHFANIPRFELSSSKIRSRWVEDLTIRYMVTLPIWDYINKNNLSEVLTDWRKTSLYQMNPVMKHILLKFSTS